MTHTDVWPDLLTALTASHSVDSIKNAVHTHGSPLYLMSLHAIRAHYTELTTQLPMVRHHYAIKCLSLPEVITTIKNCDGYFDVATTGEIDRALACGVDPARIIHTHPMVRQQDVAEALDRGVNRFVFDSASQIPMLQKFNGRITLLLRIAIPNQEAQINLSAKFGLDPLWAEETLLSAKKASLDIVGVSFHAGSQMANSDKMCEGIRIAHKVFETAKNIGYVFRVLDIGGGFPAHYTKHVSSLKEFCKPVGELLNQLFDGVEILSEPGRGVVGDSAISVSSVMGVATRGGVPWYYLDDGVYGAYSGVIFEHGEYPIITLKQLENPEISLRSCVLAGPTCDSVDVIVQDIELPNLEAGDIVLGLNMGAYSIATTTEFNSFPRAKVIFVD